MPLTKQEKQTIIEELKEKIDKQKSIVFADFTKLKVKDLSNLRKIMRKEDCELKVAKKTLISIALKGKNITVDLDQLKGEIALGFGYKDEITPFKIIHNFSKENENLKLLGGLAFGEFYGLEQAVTLAKLPSKEEILAQIFYSTNYSIFGIFDSLQKKLNVSTPTTG